MIDKFHIMAILQTARAKVLGYSLSQAKIYGVSKALYYLVPNTVKGINGKLSHKDYDRLVKSAFGNNYHRAWNDAQKIVGIIGKQILLSHQDFYEVVYKLRRGDLLQRWNNLSKPPQYFYAYTHQINHSKKK
jgi:hypothetical protein